MNSSATELPFSYAFTCTTHSIEDVPGQQNSYRDEMMIKITRLKLTSICNA